MTTTELYDATAYARDVAIENRAVPNDIEKFIGELSASFGFAAQSQGGMTPTDQVNSLVGWVYVCVERIRSSMAQVPLRCKWRNNDGSEPETITDFSHPLVSLFENPNGLDTKFDFWSSTVTYQLLVGSAYWLKVRGLGRDRSIKETWSLPAHLMTPWYDDAGRQLLGYEVLAFGRSKQIPLSELVVMPNFNPANRFIGYSTLSAASEAVRGKDATRAARLKALENDILSSKFFTTDQRLDTSDWTLMAAAIQQRASGPNRAGVPVVLHSGVKPASTGWNAELPFRESDKDARDEILGTFGVPPLLAGVVENANNSNTASQETVYAKYTIQPKCEFIQQRINKFLVPEFRDPTLFVQFDNCVPADRLLENTIDNRNVASGVVTPNEQRERLGLPPAEWGDKPRWVKEAEIIGQSAIGAVESVNGGGDANPIVEQPPKPEAKPEGDDDVDNEDVQAGGPSSGRKSGRRQPATREAHRRTLVRSIKQDYQRLEGNAVPTIRKFFATQAKRIKDRVVALYSHLPQSEPNDERHAVEVVNRECHFVELSAGKTGRLYVDGTIVEECGSDGHGRIGRAVECTAWCLDKITARTVEVRELPSSVEESLDAWEQAAEDLAGRMLPKIRESIAAGAGMQADELAVDNALDLDAPIVRQWLQQKQRDYWNDTVNETTKKLLSERLADVLADRPTLAKMVDVVEEVMGSRIQSSAENIARTEIVGAYGAGANIVRDDVGVTSKEWFATMDANTRMAHADADGQVVRQDEPFVVGGEQLDHPGDPKASTANICRCRCSAVAVIED